MPREQLIGSLYMWSVGRTVGRTDGRTVGLSVGRTVFPKPSQSLPKSPQSLPKASQSLPKASQSLPKGSQSLPRAFPRSPQTTPNYPKTTPKRPETIFHDFGGQKAVFCTTFRHFSQNVGFSFETSAFSSPTFCRRPARKPYFLRKVLEGCAKNGPKSHFLSHGAHDNKRDDL